MKKAKMILAILWLLVLGIIYYLTLPAMNIHSPRFWMYLIVLILVPLYLATLTGELSRSAKLKEQIMGLKPAKGKKSSTMILAVIGIILLIVMGSSVYGLPLFHAKTYSSILKIEEMDFSEDIDESRVLDKVALMDTDSARILGNRKIGSLSDVVSQFDVAYEYSQIDFTGSPLKVAPLEYAGFFKYLANKTEGIPGYVTVDPVGQSTKYVKLDEGMKYVPSSYFQKDLARHIRFQYPTAIFENLHFEVDEKGHPYYIASVMDYKIGLFNGQTIQGVITCDPITGETEYYPLKDIPTWVDMAYSGDLLVEQFDWFGTYNNGFFNSLFAKKGCRKSTADYGYIAKEGDIWIYTGVTSVNEDASNIGFIMVNERTGEAHYFTIPGADETSAMNAAEGEVQEKGYRASFPSLINVKGTATYIMLLKDANDIVKMYAMVNVEQYNLVTTGETLEECYDRYCRLIGLGETTDTEDENQTDQDREDTEVFTGETQEKEFTVKSITSAVINGNTYYYFTDEQGQIYKQKFSENEKLLLIKKGDVIHAECGLTDTGIYVIVTMID
ncbi:MAG: hypothetical protein ACI39H_10295 [Lachnospiraceae bacterium]